MVCHRSVEDSNKGIWARVRYLKAERSGNSSPEYVDTIAGL